MYGMVGFLLKSLIEVTRMTTFERAGLQQMQVDVQFMRPGLKALVGGELGLVEQLCDECVLAATDRALNAQLLEPGVLGSIL